MKYVFICLLVVASFCFVYPTHADQITHAFGNTGYMIREAMHAKANKKDKANYKHALKLQKEAKKYLRGTHKKGRHLKKALMLTMQAYEVAKMARDNALYR